MSLQLDARQRAVLLEMGVRVWQPMPIEPPATSLTPPDAEPAPAAVPRAAPLAKPAGTAAEAAAATHAAAAQAPHPTGPASLADGASATDWGTLAQAVASCQACGLCAGRRHSVLQPLAVPQADWLVVGDPPEEDDDLAGRPFAGPAGVLLDNMLRAARATRTPTQEASELAPDGGLVRALSAAYVTHIVKCRPPQARVPQAAELSACAAFLQREIALVRPKVILALGRLAIQVLLQEHAQAAAQPLGKQRGTVYRYQGIPVVVSYAPQALMRNGADKGKAWADLCLAMDQMDRRV